MPYETIGELAEDLRLARQAAALTQRELGQRVGLPQSHISRIESGGVDLQLTSLIELARALDLELRLVPRKALPAVEGAVRAHGTAGETSRALSTLAEQAALARRIKAAFPALRQADHFEETIRSIPPIQFDAPLLKALNDALKPAARLRKLLEEAGGTEEIGRRLREATSALQSFRNAQVHNAAPLRQLSAYRLEEDDD